MNRTIEKDKKRKFSLGHARFLTLLQATSRREFELRKLALPRGPPALPSLPTAKKLCFAVMRKERLLVYDRTCTGAKFRPGLSHSWVAGWWIYRAMGRLDACIGVDRWEDALQWLANRPGPIAEIQYWGHGKWGELFVAQDRLDIDSLRTNAPMANALNRIAKKLGPESLVWFRTCETFGAVKGQSFAAACAERLGCRVAGHTFIIGPWQSGLHSLAPGQSPHWPTDEGLALGTPQEPIEAHWSARRAPNTIHCLQGHVPSGY